MIKPNHISYVYDSYKAKATVYELPYLQCSEMVSEDNQCLVVFGMKVLNQKLTKDARDELTADLIVDNNPLILDQLVNVSIEAPSLQIKIGHSGHDTRIYNSSMICKNIIWETDSLSIESYPPQECLMVAKEGFIGSLAKVEIVSDYNLKVFAPNLSSYFWFIRYNYDLEDTSSLDITKFTHALRCILTEFRTHKKDTLAKTAERIDNVTVSNSSINQEISIIIFKINKDNLPIRSSLQD